MPSVVTLQVQSTPSNPQPPLSPTRNTGFRKAMKKFFRSTSNNSANTPVESSLDRKSRFSRSSNLLTPDDSDSRRGKSLDGRPSYTGSNMGATSSAVHLPCTDSQRAKEAAPPSSFRQRFRPKSLQPLAKPCSQSSEPMTPQQHPDSDSPSHPKPHAASDSMAHPTPAAKPPGPTPTIMVADDSSAAPEAASPTATSFGAPMPRAPGATDTPIASTAVAPRAPHPPTSSDRAPKEPLRDDTIRQAPRELVGTSTETQVETKAPQRLQEKVSETQNSVLTPVLTASPNSISIPRPLPQTPDHPQVPPCSTSAAPPPPPPPRSTLRLRVDASTLPPRLPSLPGPSPFNAEFMSSDISGLPNNAYSNDEHLAMTPQPPGAFTHPTTHVRSSTFSIGTTSSPAGAMSPRRLTNASTPGTYVMSSPMAPGATTTLKMTPSLIMSRPSSVAGATSPPMRFPSLLVSGVSGGEQVTRSRTVTEAGGSRPSTTGPMRSALPALRRDGSSFYMNMPNQAAAASVTPLPADDDGDSSDGTMEMDMDDEENPASDDDSDDGTRTPAPAKTSIMAKAVKAMTSPLLQPSSPTSYFRRQPSSSSGEYSTPSARRDAATTPGPAHRMSLVASGAPSTLLSTVQDDHDGETRQQNPVVSPRTPKQQETPASNRDTLYHTPLQTPNPLPSDAGRSTMYFDADDEDPEQQVPEMPEPRSGSAFTTSSAASTSTVVRPPAPQQAMSSSTIRASPSRPPIHPESSGDSALGLEIPAAVATPNRRRAGSTRDYFSSQPPSGKLQTPVEGALRAASIRLGQMPRTPGGRPGMYNQISHSMLDFSSLGMGADEPDPVTASPRVGKGKQKEVISEGRAQSPTRSPKPPRSPVLARRRSLPDMSGLRAMPPPYPKYSTREEEGKEVLPPYSCRIHFEASLMRKMEFNSPGLVARDRGWRRVYIILNGTSLWIFKHNPRSHPVKSQSGSRLDPVARMSYPPGGRKGDGVVHVEDVVVGAPHVHLPEDILPTVDASLKKTPSRGSRESVNGQSSSASRRSFDTSRRSSEAVPRRSMGASRSSMSSSSNITSSTAATSPAASSPEDDFEKITSPVAPPGPQSVLGATRPSNSQSNYPGAGSSLLASLQSNSVLRQYSLANAETGLASDYLKRKNVIRVRAEGEQFLIQADNVLMAIDWIETFQAGANVALDLDDRPMPKVPALPRRRRRRRATVAAGDDTPAPAPPPPQEAQPQPKPNAPRSLFGRRRE